MSNGHDDDDDGWLEDDTGSPSHHELHREWNARRREFSTSGLRDGYEAGKEESVQEGFNHGYTLGATAGYEWGLLKGAAAAAFANIQEQDTTTTTQDKEDANAAEMIRVAHTLLEELDQNDIKKQECGSLWEEHGEMKDRFPEREPPSVVAEASRRQGEIKSKAVAALEDAGIRIQRMESKN